MGPETQHIPSTLREFQSEVGPLQQVANIAFQLLAKIPLEEERGTQNFFTRNAQARSGEVLLSDRLLDLINVIKGNDSLNEHLARFVIEMWDILRGFEKEFAKKLGEQTVKAAIDTLGRILDCNEVVKMKRENPPE